MSVFVDSFSMADFGPESMKSGSKPGLGLVLRLDSLEYWSIFIK